MALTEDDDLVALMTGGDPLGAQVAVTAETGSTSPRWPESLTRRRGTRRQTSAASLPANRST